MMFSYGSGCAASMFVLRFTAGYKQITQKAQFKQKLAQRTKVTPEDYDQIMAKRERMFGKFDYTPTDSIETLLPGTFYLTKVDKKYQRYYAVKQKNNSKPEPEGKLMPDFPT